MVKKAVIFILIFILLSSAPQVGYFCGWVWDNTPGIVAQTGILLSDTYTQARGAIGNFCSDAGKTAAAFYNQASEWASRALPAIAPAATQPDTPSQAMPATPTPSAGPTPTPTPTPTPAPTPAPSPSMAPQTNLFGTISGQTYANEAVGLTLDFPKGYTAWDQQAIKDSFAQNQTDYKDAMNDPQQVDELIRAGVLPVFVASKHPGGYTGGFNSQLGVNFQQMENLLPGDNLKEIADYIKLSLEKTQGYSNVKDPQITKINGTQAALITATETVQKYKVSRKFYLLQNGDWLIQVILSSTEKTEMSEMDKAVQSLAINAFTDGGDRGNVAGQTYTNRSGGFTVVFPAGYTATNDSEAIRKIDLESFEAYKGIYKDPDSMKQSIEEGKSATLFLAYKHPKGYKTGFYDMMSVSMLKADSFKGSVMDYAGLEKQTLALLSDKITVEGPVPVQINGVNGAELAASYKVGANTVLEEAFIFEKNHYLVAVVLSAVDEAGIKELEQAFDAIRMLTEA